MLSSLLLAGGSACSRKEYITFNLRHSSSLSEPKKDWPGKPEKTLTPAQQEVFEQRGTPDFIRFWWRDSGNFPENIDPRFLMKEEIAATKQSWIYTRQGDEVIFDSAYASTSVPISDKLMIIIKEGDPEERQVREDRESGQVEEIWRYISTGREYRFHGDTLYQTRQFSDPMSSYLKG